MFSLSGPQQRIRRDREMFVVYHEEMFAMLSMPMGGVRYMGAMMMVWHYNKKMVGKKFYRDNTFTKAGRLTGDDRPFTLRQHPIECVKSKIMIPFTDHELQGMIDKMKKALGSSCECGWMEYMCPTKIAELLGWC